MSQQAMTAREQALGRNHIRVAENTRLQAQLLMALGREAEAGLMRERTLEIEKAHAALNSEVNNTRVIAPAAR